MIDGFWAHFENEIKPSGERVTDLESRVFNHALGVTFFFNLIVVEDLNNSYPALKEVAIMTCQAVEVIV